MACNGGTLRGNPQTPRNGNLNCSQCGVLLDSIESLNVHNMHYHSETINRWGGPPIIGGNGGGGTTTKSISSSTASNSPTDSENNNHPKQHHSIQHISSKSSSPLHNTISAAADSSDNQPTTTQSSSGIGSENDGNIEQNRSSSYSYVNSGNSIGSNSTYQNQSSAALTVTDMHYPSYMHGYEQYYHHHTMEYGLPPPPPHFLNTQSLPPPPLTPQEYKPVPSPRYHPYINHSLNQSHQNVTNSSLSPRVVSSSSPTQNNLMQSITTAPSNAQQQRQAASRSQPTPSPSPKQCDKCGLVCETACQLSEHYASAHGTVQMDSRSMNRSGQGSGDETELSNYAYPHFIKEEPPCDILDLDSQKMVYPPHDGSNQVVPLPSMHSIHSMQRPPMMWPHDAHAFMPPHPQDIKPVIYAPAAGKEYSTNVPIKQEFSPTQIKTEYGSSVGGNSNHHLPTALPHQQQQQDVKPFNNEVTGNQITTSPSEFPSTTTPQENGSQFRTFEATSSLPNNAPTVKSSSWKSNEARRPKTYNCTACNKWFTSSGHLKRHYNTTLHKNAVKSSGQPDPATMPISIHHHPTRDQNKNNHHNRGSPAQPPQPPIPPEPPRSPEYSPQYTPPLGFQQVAQGFQQYGTAIHSNPGGPPNGQAGPSVLASQPRGLLIYTTNTTGTQQVLQEQEQAFILPPMQSHTTNLPEQYNITSPITINTNTTTQLYPVTLHQGAPQQNYHTIIGNSSEMIIGDDGSCTTSDMILDYGSMIQNEHNKSMSSYSTTVPCISALRRLTGGAAAYQGDTAPPFSPDIPESYQSMCHQSSRSTTPNRMAATSPATPSLSPHDMPPYSPSITSTGTLTPIDPKLHHHNTEAAVGDQHRCIQCDKVFNKACYLTQHNKTFHSGEKPYKCQRCGKRFPCGQSHEEHFAKHGGEKPFKCDQCPKQFNHKTDLRRHMCLHSGTKPYSCEICGKGFIRKDHMMKHCETHRRKSALMAKKLVDAVVN